MIVLLSTKLAQTVVSFALRLHTLKLHYCHWTYRPTSVNDVTDFYAIKGSLLAPVTGLFCARQELQPVLRSARVFLVEPQVAETQPLNEALKFCC